MSRLGERLAAEVGGTRPLGSFRDQVQELVRLYGSETRAATATGIRRSTFWRWKTGATTPRASSVASIGSLVRAGRAGGPSDRDVALTLVENRTGRRDGAERRVTGRQLGLEPGTMDRVRAAYVRTGDPEAMAAAFVAGVTVPFYRAALAAGLDRPTGGSGGGRAGGGDDDDDEPGDEDYDEDYGDVYEDLTGEGDAADDGSGSYPQVA